MPFSRRLLLLMEVLFILRTVKANSSEILSERFEIEIKVKTMIKFFSRFWPTDEPNSSDFETSISQDASSFKDNFRKLNQMFILKNILSLRQLHRMIPEHKELMSEAPKEVFLLSPSLGVKSKQRNKMLPIPRIG